MLLNNNNNNNNNINLHLAGELKKTVELKSNSDTSYN